MDLRYSGNGTSKDNAIFFTSANSFVDHIEMQSAFIKQNNIEATNIRSVGEVSDKYMYDIYETSKGHLWFRVPNNIIE